ncbi:MAG: dihydrolipoamide acetyltransferase component of pyruvate dehydrogenase complex [Pirellulaceae bacterium]|nr:MAG: dihydrolipoamide acetyltransferase component of pyruvate dehydrogenase complex [Pirellulaceae bacterium]
MAMEVKLPELGEGVESGDVLEVLVQEGDQVQAEQPLLELETDKATVTVPSPAAGKITKLLVKPGQTVAVGEVIASLDTAGTDGGSSSSAPPTSSQQDEAPAKGSDAAQTEPKTADSETSSKSAEAPTSAAPTSDPPRNRPEASPQVSSPTGGTATPAPSAPEPTAKESVPPAPAPATGLEATADDKIPAGPAVRRFAREVGVDLRTVQGTGEGGRITRDDVLRAVRELGKSRAPAPAADGQLVASEKAPAATHSPGRGVALPGEPGSDEYGPIRVERLSKIRKTIAAQMHKSWSTVPRVTNFDDADITELEALRQANKEEYAAQGIKLTTMPFIIKAVAMALKHHPTINAIIDMEKEQVIYRDYVNIGIAVDTPRGLVVPNIRHADQLTIPEIARALADMAVRVRNGDFGVNELRGGTFSISNLGAIGGTYSTPVVNVPEVAILLLGRSRKLPVVMPDDSIRPRLMLPLSLSYDHRLVDGGAAARFLNDVIGYLESPSRLLLAIS